MKKIILLILITFFLTGCINIENSDYNMLIDQALSNKNSTPNKSYKGYSYYLPVGVRIDQTNSNNIIFKYKDYRLYMYVDLISYYYKKVETYTKNQAYVSIPIKNEDKFGYLEVNNIEKEKYLVEIMYNYAKIEVIVDKCDIKEVVSYAMSLLHSISYNDTMIKTMVEKNILNYNEVEFNIFETAKSDSNIIEYDEDASMDNQNEQNIPDTDLIN